MSYTFDYENVQYVYEKSPLELMSDGKGWLNYPSNWLSYDSNSIYAKYNSPLTTSNKRPLLFNVSSEGTGKLDISYEIDLKSLFNQAFPELDFNNVTFYGYNGSYGSSPYRVSTNYLFSYQPSSWKSGEYIKPVAFNDKRESYEKYGGKLGLTFRYTAGILDVQYGFLYIPDEWKPIDYIDPFAPKFDESNLGIIGTLYDLGKSTLNSIPLINEIFNFSVGGMSVFSLLLGGGFIVYMGWSIVKWFIPV